MLTLITNNTDTFVTLIKKINRLVLLMEYISVLPYYVTMN